MCELSDLRYLQEIVEYWTVDGEGESRDYVCNSEDGDFYMYCCLGCNEEFDTWQDAQSHLMMQEVAA